MILALFQMRISDVEHLKYAEAERIVALRLQCMHALQENKMDCLGLVKHLLRNAFDMFL